jgi:hypothetical protein
MPFPDLMFLQLNEIAIPTSYALGHKRYRRDFRVQDWAYGIPWAVLDTDDTDRRIWPL